MEQFIVGEVSKNWRHGLPVSDTPLVSQQFEHMIAVNQARGYKLHSYVLNRFMIDEHEMNETIIAVFERVTDANVH